MTQDGMDPPGALRVRDAVAADLAALEGLKPGEALHRDRLRDAASPDFRYLVLVEGEEVVGLACLVFVRPGSWSDAADTSRLPQLVDLHVAPNRRGRGFGSFFIGQLETLAARRGSRSLFVAVEFPANVRAHALYTRLGFQQLQPEPYPCHWEFTDSAGRQHQGDDWRVDLSKPLSSGPGDD